MTTSPGKASASPAGARTGRGTPGGTATKRRERGVAPLQRTYGNAFVTSLFAGAPIQRACGCGGSCCSTPAEVQRARRPVGGAPLPASTRAAMESSFGTDFGGVRLHTDSDAERLAAGVGARAFTSGSDVYFGAGQYQPGTRAGHGLIAHELAHVVQQRSGRASAAGIDTPQDEYEREADAAAAAVMDGIPVRIGQRAGAPRIQRATCPTFEVPPEKGRNPQVRQRYEAQKQAKGFRVRNDERNTPTSTLRRRWLEKKGHATEYDRLTGGGEAGWPKDSEGRSCTVDHIVEWVLHGNNPGDSENSENMMLMAGRRNSGAGGRVQQQIQAGNCTVFSGYRISGAMPPDECMVIDEAFEPWLAARGSALGAGATGGPFVIIRLARSVIPIDLSQAAVSGPAAARRYTIQLATQRSQELGGLLLRARRRRGEDPRALLIRGMQFTLDAGGSLAANGTLDAQMSENVAWPFTGTAKPLPLIVDKSDDNKVKAAATKYRGQFRGLSETEFDFRTDDQGELEGRADLRPSLPFLQSAVVSLVAAGGTVSARVQIPVRQLNLPVPGLTLGGDGLVVGFEDGQLFASGQVTLQYGTAVRGELRAQASPRDGLTAGGRIDLTVPGIDQATGRVDLDREGNLSGRIEVGAAKIRIPGVRSARLVVSIQRGALSGEGTLDLAVPAVRQARLGFGVDARGEAAITGTAALQIPGTRDASLELAYRSGELTGSGRAAFAIPGLEGANLELRYAQGNITGTAAVSYRRGRLSGTVTAALDERHRLSGSGELAYEIAPGLIAFAGMRINPDGSARIQGGLRVPETVDLFDRRQVEKELFRLPTIEIPIIAIPVGTRSVGLVATISARVVARAGIGPGQLRRMRLLVDVDPAAIESSFDLQASAELFVPADAELALAISGGIGLSLAIARAIGGIEAEGAAGLRAQFVAGADLRFKDGQLAVKGAAELSAAPRLVFRLRAFVRVEADLFVTTIEIYSKEWQLAQLEVGSSLRIGVRVPFDYVFGKPFELSLDQVEFNVPRIDPMQFARELLPA